MSVNADASHVETCTLIGWFLSLAGIDDQYLLFSRPLLVGALYVIELFF